MQTSQQNKISDISTNVRGSEVQKNPMQHQEGSAMKTLPVVRELRFRNQTDLTGFLKKADNPPEMQKEQNNLSVKCHTKIRKKGSGLLRDDFTALQLHGKCSCSRETLHSAFEVHRLFMKNAMTLRKKFNNISIT